MHGAERSSDGDDDAAYSICFNIRVIEVETTWETILVRSTLFVEIPPDVLRTGSKERFYTVVDLLFEIINFKIYHLFDCIVCID